MNPQRGLGPKACIICGTEFVPYRAAHLTCGSACGRERTKQAARVRAQQPAVKAAQAEATRRWRANNPDAALTRAVRQYGIDAAGYARMLLAQGGGCAICGERCPSGRRLAVDHCHATGAVRGLLCVRCNKGLGYFRDRPDLLHQAVEYLDLAGREPSSLPPCPKDMEQPQCESA